MNICQAEGCSNSTKNPKYCSSSCSAKVTNLGKRRHGNGPVEIICERCGNVFLGNKSRIFCSSKCSALGPSDPTSSRSKRRSIEGWLSGTWDGTTKSGLSSTVRNYLIKEAGVKCSSPKCSTPGGFSEVNPTTGRVPLEIDHLDGNCFNNRRENLRVVCPNCHALTPTYRALNKGSGRAYRGKYSQYERVDQPVPSVVD